MLVASTRYSRRQLLANAGHDGRANLQRSPTGREYQPIAVAVSRLGVAVAACATELPYLSPHPHQTRSNVDRELRLPRCLDWAICLIPPTPRCERT
jgi:hypothetical protein